MNVEFQLVQEGEVWKPEFGNWKIDMSNSFEVAGVPLQAIVEPFLRVYTEASSMHFQ